MTYTEVIDLLEHLQSGRIRPGLQNIRDAAASLGNPHSLYPAIHIAGTNGKGSVAAMIESILRANGYKTGLYTSPHIFDFSERIRFAGRKIPHESVVELTEEILPYIQKYDSTYFEAATLIAFLYFARMKIDIAVIETGLGGKWDATNILTPILSVITKIGIDHQDYLGNTLQDITKEKAGIIKARVPCVISDQDDEVVDILVRCAREAGANAVRAENEVSIKKRKKSDKWNCFDFEYNGERLRNVCSPLIGDHQLSNTGTALTAVSVLKSGNFVLEPEKILFGLKYCTLDGRFEKVNDNPPFIVDVGHNPDAFTVLRKLIMDFYPDHRIILIFGVMRDKQYTEMLSIIKPLCKSIVGLRLPGKRALSTDALSKSCSRYECEYYSADSAAEAIRIACSQAGPNDLILAAGSHITVQETKNALYADKELFKNA